MGMPSFLEGQILKAHSGESLTCPHESRLPKSSLPVHPVFMHGLPNPVSGGWSLLLCLPYSTSFGGWLP